MSPTVLRSPAHPMPMRSLPEKPHFLDVILRIRRMTQKIARLVVDSTVLRRPSRRTQDEAWKPNPA